MPNVFGYEIPYKDELSGAEVEALERIYSERMANSRRVVEIAAALLKTRTKERVKAEELLRMPYRPEDEDGVSELITPFSRLVEAREYRQALSHATSTSLSELKTLRERISETLTALDEIISEKETAVADGSESKAS